MDEKGTTTDHANKTLQSEADRVLQEAKIVARWAKKPFYIS
jgi:hypothetical protein